MSSNSVPVKKTGYRAKRAPKANKGGIQRRSLDDFKAPPREGGKHEIGDQVRIKQSIYDHKDTIIGWHENGTPVVEIERNFPRALAGEFGTFTGMRKLLVAGGKWEDRLEIKLKHTTAFLPDDPAWVEWI